MTQDWHPEGHCSFGKWPRHCVMASKGADFIRGLHTEYADLIIRKGTNNNIDSYSAFVENDMKTPTGLQGYLSNHNIQNVFIAGLALDYCVAWTALDSARFGRNTSVILDACKGIAPDTQKEAIARMKAEGVNIILSTDL
jgi:nicotinamidase/pyrazinamidase